MTTSTWRSAAALWADARRAGRPATDDAGLDGDVLIAAQALAEDAIVVTTNPRHFEKLVEARTLDEIRS